MSLLSAVLGTVGNFIAPGIGGVVGTALGGAADVALGSSAQASQNRTNLQIATDTTSANMAEAQRNRDFQAEQVQQAQAYNTTMSNSAYQRAVKDMEAAGLNPMLAYTQGGASTPTSPTAGGSQGQAVSPGQLPNPLASGLAAASQAAQIDYTNAQTKNLDADTAIKASMMKDPTKERNAAGDYPTTSFPAAESEARSRQLHYAADNEIEKIGLTKEQTKLVTKEIDNAVAQGKQINANTASTEANTVLARLQKAEYENRAAFQKAHPDLAPWVGPGGVLMNSASSLIRAVK